jgi:putative transposase
VIEAVRVIRDEQPRVGTRKLHVELKESAAVTVGRDRLFGILREQDMLIKPKKSFTKTTYSGHDYVVAANLIKELSVTAPKQVLVGDCTYLRLQGGLFMYLFLLTDLSSRRIVGYHVSRDLSHHAALMALGMARETLGDTKGVIHHSDRGCQYCCHDYLDALREAGMVPSMTDENHCYQNAVAERVNGILKDEFNLDQVFPSVYAVKAIVKDAITVYNTKRRHLSLKMKTPEYVYNQKAA